VLAAVEEINKLSDFKGPKAGGRVTPGTLFRANALYFDASDPKGRSVTPPGVLDGPLISQFLLRDAPYGAQWIGAQIRTATPASEFMTNYEEWLAIQNGAAPKRRTEFDPTPRYIATGRDLSEYIHLGPALGWAAALMLATPGGGTDPQLLRDVSADRTSVLPLEPLSQIENPRRCWCHLRLGPYSGTTHHGDH
jgi:hypothetical protein